MFAISQMKDIQPATKVLQLTESRSPGRHCQRIY